MKQQRNFWLMVMVTAVFALAGCSVLQAPPEASAPIEAAPVGESSGDATVFTISPEGSTVRFELDEDLRGNRITVVGSTDQVAGQIAADFNNLAAAQVGEIRINARTLTTDNDFRNRAINNQILDTGQYEFITFAPTAVNGLPGSVAVGETVEFSIDGNLTIRDVTQPVTFVLEVTAVSATQLQGTASATISRDAFGLTIPDVPSVANVEEEVELYIDFTANAS